MKKLARGARRARGARESKREAGDSSAKGAEPRKAEMKTGLARSAEIVRT